jgi:NADH dehydrogenase [ubiquinone] 1 alpha subcomplex assembly factor 1
MRLLPPPRSIARHLVAFLLFCIAMNAASAPPALDFADPATAQRFRVINDGVMGGVSTSRLVQADGALRFEGEVSLENSGGFASFRGPAQLPDGATALLLTVRGDGQRYKLTLKLDDSNATAQYQASFVAPRDWATIRFATGDFSASFRGRPVSAPPLALGQARAIGVLISERQAGPFWLEVREVRTE